MLLLTANSMLPKGGGGDEGGKTPNQVLAELSSKFLHDIRDSAVLGAVAIYLWQLHVLAVSVNSIRDHVGPHVHTCSHEI